MLHAPDKNMAAEDGRTENRRTCHVITCSERQVRTRRVIARRWPELSAGLVHQVSDRSGIWLVGVPLEADEESVHPSDGVGVPGTLVRGETSPEIWKRIADRTMT